MSDDAPGPAEQAPAPKAVEAPKLAYVKGGTGTSKSEELYQKRHHEAEERRDLAQREKQAAASQQKVALPGMDTPLHMPGSPAGAVQYSSQMTAHPEVPKAYVLLTYLTPTGSVALGPNGKPVQCCSDIIVGANPDLPTELCLVIVCPRCQADSHKHQQDNQLRIFQSNKHFELKPGMGAPTFLFEGEIFRSAGMIIESERFSCPDCGWRARIENNRVRPD